MSKILLIDCYDSFTYILLNYLKCLGADVRVVKSDDADLSRDLSKDYSHFILSPGPGHPSEYPLLLRFIRQHLNQKPMLGVCLGHQAIAYTLGANIVHAPKIMHGKPSKIQHNHQGLFKYFPQDFQVMRYHSLMIEEHSVSREMKIDAWVTENGQQVIMSFHHELYPVFGLQYHPESIFSEYGMEVLNFFIEYQLRSLTSFK